MGDLDEAMAWHATVEDGRPRLIPQPIDGAIRPPHIAHMERVRSGLKMAVEVAVGVAQTWRKRSTIGAYNRERKRQPRAVKVDPTHPHGSAGAPSAVVAGRGRVMARWR